MANPVLVRQFHEYQSLGAAPSTCRTYQAGGRFYQQFCKQYNIPSISLTLQNFCTSIAEGVSYKTIKFKFYLVGIRLEHLERGFQDPTNDILRGVDLGIVNVNAGNSNEDVNVGNYDGDVTLLELKHPGLLTMSRCPTVGLPHAFGQVVGGLYLLAVCKILHNLLIKNEIPCETITTKGLLVKRKDKMVLFKLEAAIKKTVMSEMVTIHYQALKNEGCPTTSSLTYMCAGLHQLFNN